MPDPVDTAVSTTKRPSLALEGTFCFGEIENTHSEYPLIGGIAK